MDHVIVTQWPEGWKGITPNEQRALEAELKREAMPGHPLYNVSISAVARRGDYDDVLFAIAGSSSVAVVHLSYGQETRPLWPNASFFGSLSEWKEQDIKGEDWDEQDKQDATLYSLRRASESFGE